MGAQNAGCGEAIFEYSVSRALFRKRMGNGRSTNGNQCARRKKGAIMFDPGSTGFMILGAMLVFLMTPALAFFYGGLSRRKNVLNTMFMSIAVIGFVGVLWIVAGWSFAYGGDGSCPFFGGFDQIFCVGLLDNMLGGSDLALSHDTYPVLVDVAFQAAFAIITIAIITGSLAGRMKFGAVLAFISIWLLLVYAPLAHMVWGGDGSLIGDTIGALDFAGGDVVHISSGLTGLILCVLLGKRRGYGMMSYRPHNIPFVALGASLLWFGWFGFNPGSQLAAAATTDQIAISHVFLTTNLAACAGGFFALTVSWWRYGKPSLSFTLNGVLAGLVGITAGCDCVSATGAVLIGAICGIVMIFSVDFIDKVLRIDDPVGASSVHGVCGFLGTILTGLFSTSEGVFYTGTFGFFGAQLFGAVIVGCWAAGMGFIIFKSLDKIHGLRVPARIEEEGLDIYEHGESAYN